MQLMLLKYALGNFVTAIQNDVEMKKAWNSFKSLFSLSFVLILLIFVADHMRRPFQISAMTIVINKLRDLQLNDCSCKERDLFINVIVDLDEISSLEMFYYYLWMLILYWLVQLFLAQSLKPLIQHLMQAAWIKIIRNPSFENWNEENCCLIFQLNNLICEIV